MPAKLSAPVLIDRGLNSQWNSPLRWTRIAPGRHALTIVETLGKTWGSEVIEVELPKGHDEHAEMCFEGEPVPAQCSGRRLSFVVEGLQPLESRRYELRKGIRPASKSVVTFRQEKTAVLSNVLISVQLPSSQKISKGSIPGPILSIRSGTGNWLGEGRMETPLALKSIKTHVIESGSLWKTVEVLYSFAEGKSYRMHIRMGTGDRRCEIRESSNLSVNLWPAERPYMAIGSLGASAWKTGEDRIGEPCVRPWPMSNFLFDVRKTFHADRLVTHSTGAVEIMDLPLRNKKSKSFTAMRAAYSAIDGGWMGIYNSHRDEILGVHSVDIARWQAPDENIHPCHRTPGATTEVLLADSAEGSCLKFPIENIDRRWVLTVESRRAHGLDYKTSPGQPLRLPPNSDHLLWSQKTGTDFRLDKVKDWVTDWPDRGDAHPSVLCRRADFAAIRRNLRKVPELQAYHQRWKDSRAADNYILTGKSGGLKAIEEATHARELVDNILRNGMTGPVYCIGFARPLRRYAIACDIMWDSFSPDEKVESRRVCALAAYIMTDGDFWQYAYRQGETTYLPNFNTDIIACVGIIALFLRDHPCSDLWLAYCLERMDIEVERHLREDGGGEENIGAYYFSTWMQLYLPIFWALRQNGIRDYSKHPNVHAGGRFMVNLLAPPDPRDHGKRSVPPIGDHPHVQKSFPVMDWLASFLKDSDPELAANLKWAWRVGGSTVGNLHDHFGPRSNPFTRHNLFHDPALREKEPQLKSCNLPHVGAILRSHGESGSYLMVKAGRVHSHHNAGDEGSFHYFGRGIPLVLDGLQLQNGSPAHEHNGITFGADKGHYSTATVEHFHFTEIADYLRVRSLPRQFACDGNYLENAHRSGFIREFILVKAPHRKGIEYLAIKDTTLGPDPCQWNIDVLSRKPQQKGPAHVWFPGHFGMGLDVMFVEPLAPSIHLEKGLVNPKLFNATERRNLQDNHLLFKETEHWLLHAPAGPGATFLTVLFPRANKEAPPRLEYVTREETLLVTHSEGSDLIFLRPNADAPLNLRGVYFQGRAGLLSERNGRKTIADFDAVQMEIRSGNGVPYQLV